MSLQLNTIINNRYRIDEFLGRGGMAEVYRVYDLERSVPLAMKVLNADLAEDRVFVRRFQREAATLAKLQHPHIVRFYGLEQSGRLVFMLMDFIDGITLRTRIFDLNRPFSSDEMMQVIRPVCAALNYAHRQGFIHCDVKPANIMIDKANNVYVSDFGIARMTETATSTMAGVGTPAYMAPEQILGKDPIPQTDIYSLGITLFEMLSGGERPFTGELAKITGTTGEKVRWEKMNSFPYSLRQFNPEINADIEAVVMKCLEKEPENRYPSIIDFMQNLDSAFSTVDSSEEGSKSDETDSKKSNEVIVTSELSDSPSDTENGFASKRPVPPPLQKVHKSKKGIVITVIALLILLAGSILVFSKIKDFTNANQLLDFLSTQTESYVAVTMNPVTATELPINNISTATSQTYWTSATINVNLRQESNIDSTILHTIPAKTNMQVIGQSPDGEWLLVKSDDYPSYGWVKLNLLLIDFDMLNIPIIWNPPTQP